MSLTTAAVAGLFAVLLALTRLGDRLRALTIVICVLAAVASALAAIGRRPA